MPFAALITLATPTSATVQTTEKRVQIKGDDQSVEEVVSKDAVQIVNIQE